MNRFIGRQLLLSVMLMLSLTICGCSSKGSADLEPAAQEASVSEAESVTETKTNSDDPFSLKGEESDDDTDILDTSDENDDGVTMIFTGDIYPDDSVRAAYDAGGIDSIVSSDIQSVMKNADITMINEEFPFGTTGSPAKNKQYTFRVNPSYISIFNELGVDVVTLANNHTLDYGASALEETFSLLDANGIVYSGAGKTYERSKELQKITVNGIKIGILSASRVIPVAAWDSKNTEDGVFTTYDETALCSAIEEAKKECDYVMVYVHWGVEKATTPEQYERDLATKYVAAGADLVIGSHPHVLQGMEFIDGAPVYYSLGNFIFHSTTTSTMLVQVNIDKNGLSTKIIPAYASNAYLQLMSSESSVELYKKLESLSYNVTIDGKGRVGAVSH